MNMNTNVSISAPNRGDVGLALLAGVFYLLLFKAGQLLVGANVGAYPIWLSDGFALGFWFATRGRCRWPQIIAVMLANFSISFDPNLPYLVDVYSGLINASQLALAGWLTESARARFGGKWVGIGRVSVYVFTTVVVANGVCAILMAWAFQSQGRGGFEENFISLFIADGLGILIVAPLVVSWAKSNEILQWRMSPGRTFEVLAMFLAIAYVCHAIFSLRPDAFGLVPPLFYLVIPFVLWAVVRFHLRGATLAVAECALVSIYYTMHYLGPFVSGFVPTTSAVLQLQGFLAVLSISSLFAANLLEERRAAMEDAIAWRRRYDAAITASESLVYEIQFPAGTINWAGDVRRMLGWTGADFDTVDKLRARIHSDDRWRLMDTKAHFESGAPEMYTAEYRIERRDGTPALLGVSAYAITTTEANGTHPLRGIIGFAKDITEKKRIEADRVRLEAELRQAQKMEAIGRLAGGIAHDFNNILAAILGYGEMARNRAAAQVAPDSALVRQIDTIMKAGNRGRILISQILTFSRKNPEQALAVNALDVIDEMVALVRGSFPHEIIHRVSGSEPLTVFGNATELHQLFMNLAVNGLQAMPNKGALEILVGRTTLSAPLTVSQNQLPIGDYLKVAIRDHGVGIDAITRAQMFEPFFTTKATEQGTGLGLSLAMSIAKAHGGGIEVDSAPGHGATFTVYLPLFNGTASATRAVPVAHDLPRGQGEWVLLVDDEPGLRDLAEEILVGLGYQTASFGDSAEALAAFERNPGKFDAILTDEVMPGLTGTQLASRIHALNPDMPIIIITGFGGPGFELRAQQAGVMSVLRKPYQMNELAHALAAALNGTRGNHLRKR